MLADEDFRRRMKLYSHENIIQRITDAWMDTNAETLPDEDYSDAFVRECTKLSLQDVYDLYQTEEGASLRVYAGYSLFDVRDETGVYLPEILAELYEMGLGGNELIEIELTDDQTGYPERFSGGVDFVRK